MAGCTGVLYGIFLQEDFGEVGAAGSSEPLAPSVCTILILSLKKFFMLKVGEVLVSDDIKDKEFVCNLEKCKGACCVEGDFGAPLEENELAILEEIYPIVKPYLSKEGIAAIEKQGTHTKDDEGE